jgi:hypothetical protein
MASCLSVNDSMCHNIGMKMTRGRDRDMDLGTRSSRIEDRERVDRVVHHRARFSSQIIDRPHIFCTASSSYESNDIIADRQGVSRVACHSCYGGYVSDRQ